MNKNYYCVILAGGIGSRLWPSSSYKRPKQFLDIMGTGESLLQMTYKRYRKFIEPSNIIVVSNEIYKDITQKQLPELPSENLLLEPMRRNTVPSVTWAAVYLLNKNKNACMLITPADQMINREDELQKDILSGFEYISKNNRLLTMGIAPTRPETTYGYIQISDEMDKNIFKAQSFTEKPNIEFAKLFFESKEFLWNTGLYMWTAKTFIESVENSSSEFGTLMQTLRKNMKSGKQVIEIINDTFSICPNIPLETGILEKVDNVDVMQCHFEWNDIGTWNQLYNILPKVKEGNVSIQSNAMFYNCEDCVVKLPEGKIAILQDLKNYVVVEEGNILMICKKDDQQSIRKFVNDVQMNVGDDFV
ncbi:MAG: mannose-1-phosphate guanylyltransferase [Bacteroidaceae bacterium]|nr:mannose-1-phosphate guanylyltransferase [Bacteroidaceae bacterium]